MTKNPSENLLTVEQGSNPNSIKESKGNYQIQPKGRSRSINKNNEGSVLLEMNLDKSNESNNGVNPPFSSKPESAKDLHELKLSKV